MAELVDWLHHESITRAATNTASSYVRQDHHLPHGSLEPHITNADRIRQMTDEELAECLMSERSVPHCPPIDVSKYAPCDDIDCVTCWVQWLKKEVDDNES